MNKFYKNNNLQSYNSKEFNWSLIQVEMKNKLGLDVFESWLKKIEFIENSIIIFYYLYPHVSFETG